MAENTINKFTFNGVTYNLADATSGYSKVSIDRKTTSGTNIADITIDGTTTQLYAPQGGGSGTITQVKTTAGAHTAIDVSSGAATFNVPTKTSHLTNDSGFTSKNDILSVFYPVGSYYETSDTTFDPNTAWGGTWELEGGGNFHLSAGGSYPAGSTGGSADAIVPYHRHSVAKDTGAITGGAHTHDIANRSVYGGNSNYIALYKGGTGTSTNAALSETHTHDLPAHNTDYAGTSGNTTGANMPPYIVVNRWHRTA